MTRIGQIQAYCLMRNQFHWVVETLRAKMFFPFHSQVVVCKQPGGRYTAYKRSLIAPSYSTRNFRGMARTVAARGDTH
jgi:hypothetical protein